MKNMMAEYIRTVLEIDDQESIDEFIGDYMTLLNDTLPQMRTAYADKNFAELRTLAHTLKGSSANIGAEPVRAVSLSLQQSAEARDEAKCGSFLTELETLRAGIPD